MNELGMAPRHRNVVLQVLGRCLLRLLGWRINVHLPTNPRW